ncbi:hypothetical protein Pmani_003544 [Petrolisthes manimaculis]|uniref:LanC-like protein 2 n=1 Tax=Petrolisthes manimaculis TaxID=1843537 RepID=A0AAE1QIL4_9EUCA|nr:hypothetical protein Pmani_003544 [Petrolisthes manimaculis]
MSSVWASKVVNISSLHILNTYFTPLPSRNISEHIGRNMEGRSPPLRDDRCFKNPYPKEIKDDKSQVLDEEQKVLSAKYKGKLEENIKLLVDRWETNIRKGQSKPDTCVYTGTSGYSILYLRLYHQYQEESYLNKAGDLIKQDLRSLKGRRVAFLTGDSGILALGAWYFNKIGRADKCEKCVNELLKIRQRIVPVDEYKEDEVLYGRAGYLFSLLFLLQKEVRTDLVTGEVVRDVVKAILASGQQTAQKERSRSPLMYYWHDKAYVGAAHGFIGILFMLLQAREHLEEKELQEVVRGAVDYVCNLQQSSGNLPSSLNNTSDRLVHWCHGAPGAVFLFAKAYQVFKDAKYLQHAKKAGDCVWDRGLLQKGYGLCHGSSGNGYSLLYLYQVTGEVVYLYRAAQFGRWCQEYGTHGCRQPDRPYSLFEGLAGNIHFLVDLLQPDEAKFPAFVV